jgi:hypothetical protein
MKTDTELQQGVISGRSRAIASSDSACSVQPGKENHSSQRWARQLSALPFEKKRG